MATPKRSRYQGPPAFIRLTDALEQFGMNEDLLLPHTVWNVLVF